MQPVVNSTLMIEFFFFILVYGFLHFLTIFCTPIIWVNAYPYLGEIWDPKWRYIFIGFVTVPLGNEVSTRHDMTYGQVRYPTLVDKIINFTKAEPLFDT